jgi:hypothetical protein
MPVSKKVTKKTPTYSSRQAELDAAKKGITTVNFLPAQELAQNLVALEHYSKRQVKSELSRTRDTDFEVLYSLILECKNYMHRNKILLADKKDMGERVLSMSNTEVKLRGEVDTTRTELSTLKDRVAHQEAIIQSLRHTLNVALLNSPGDKARERFARIFPGMI